MGLFRTAVQVSVNENRSWRSALPPEAAIELKLFKGAASDPIRTFGDLARPFSVS